MKLVNSKKLYKLSKSILAGPSTISKGVDQFAYGISPYAIDYGNGAYTWDVDGNRYLDTIMSLGAVILGHANSVVEQSIKAQLKKGTTFSLASRLEVEVAEMLCDRIPCADMVRFGKNGNDVTSAAVRLSRHYSNSDHVLFCGYHGWQDWYASQTSMNSGVPKEIKKFSHRFEYNNLKSLEKLLIKYKGNTACVILEPVLKIKPVCNKLCQDCKTLGKCKGFLQGVRKLADKFNVILIFDEVVTGFRFHKGGYQALCNVTPDLACFSKAMANGMPLSALVGKKEIMKKSLEIFYSLTFAGETLSLAAAKAVLQFIDNNKVIESIQKHGLQFINGLNELINKKKLNNVLQIMGFPSRNFIIFKNSQNAIAENIKTYWIQQLVRKGILNNGTHLFSFAHKGKEIKKLLNVYDQILDEIKDTINRGNLSELLMCPPVKQAARDF